MDDLGRPGFVPLPGSGSVMATNYRIRMNSAEFRRMEETGTIAQGVWRAAGVTRDRAKAEITAQGRVDTGRMRNSIVARRIRGRRRGVFYEIGSQVPYDIYQHEGTQAHGPRRARLMRFKPKGQSAYVFARWVKGVTPSKFLTKALAKLSSSDFIP